MINLIGEFQIGYSYHFETCWTLKSVKSVTQGRAVTKMPNIFIFLEADVLGGRLPVCSVPRNEFNLISPGLNSSKSKSLENL